MRARVLLVVLSLSVAAAACGSAENDSGRWQAQEPQASAQPVEPSPAPPSPSVSPLPPSPSTASGCTIFPADNIWHSDISKLPVHPRSAAYVASMGATRHMHPDFGAGLIEGGSFGIPITVVPPGQKAAKVTFEYADESDKGPYPVPDNARVEGAPLTGGDAHVILLDRAKCKAYELFAATRQGPGRWQAGSGAVFDLKSNALRKAGWTSADAAGLSILAGLVQYDEVASGTIDHAIRITVSRSQNAYVWPARHSASSRNDPSLPPMGLRLRLKASVPIAGMPKQARVIAQAMKTYGVIVADNGSNWFITGTSDNRWSNSQLNALKKLTGGSFEAVDTAPLRINPNSGAAKR